MFPECLVLNILGYVPPEPVNIYFFPTPKNEPIQSSNNKVAIRDCQKGPHDPLAGLSSFISIRTGT